MAAREPVAAATGAASGQASTVRQRPLSSPVLHRKPWAKTATTSTAVEPGLSSPGSRRHVLVMGGETAESTTDALEGTGSLQRSRSQSRDDDLWGEHENMEHGAEGGTSASLRTDEGPEGGQMPGRARSKSHSDAWTRSLTPDIQEDTMPMSASASASPDTSRSHQHHHHHHQQPVPTLSNHSSWTPAHPANSWPRSKPASSTRCPLWQLHTMFAAHAAEGSAEPTVPRTSERRNAPHLAVVAASPEQSLLTDKASMTAHQQQGQRITQIVEWFRGFTPMQRNDTLRLLFEACDTPQTHLLSQLVLADPHPQCPQNCEDRLGWLPPALGEHVFSFLDPVSLCRASRVCRAWYHLAQRQNLWKQLAQSPLYRLADSREEEQVASHSQPGANGVAVVSWRNILIERFRLRRNWLHGRCTVRTFQGHDKGVLCVRLDDTKIASGSSDGTIRVWSTKTNASWSVLTLRGHFSSVRCLYMMDNQIVSGSSDCTIRVWDLACGPGWSRGSCRLTLTGHSDAVRCLDVKNNAIVSGSYDGTIKKWDIHTGACLQTIRNESQVLALQICDNLIVSGGLDKLVKLWDSESGRCTHQFEGHRGAVTCLQAVPGANLIVSGSMDGDLRFWNSLTGECIRVIDWIRSEGHTGVVRALRLYGNRLASASDDKTVKIWDVWSGKRITTLQHHSDGVTSCEFNDQLLVSGSFDVTVKLLDFSVC